MSLSHTSTAHQRIEALRTKHRELSKTIDQAYLHPSVTDVDLHQMKAKKLRLKDEILELESYRQAS